MTRNLSCKSIFHYSFDGSRLLQKCFFACLCLHFGFPYIPRRSISFAVGTPSSWNSNQLLTFFNILKLEFIKETSLNFYTALQIFSPLISYEFSERILRKIPVMLHRHMTTFHLPGRYLRLLHGLFHWYELQLQKVDKVTAYAFKGGKCDLIISVFHNLPTLYLQRIETSHR